ncbi:hypothetical protein [Mycobacterium sp. URHB0021]
MDSYEAVVLATARRARLDEKITGLAADREFSPPRRRAGMSARHLDVDRVRAGGRDRRLRPLHRRECGGESGAGPAVVAHDLGCDMSMQKG